MSACFYLCLLVYIYFICFVFVSLWTILWWMKWEYNYVHKLFLKNECIVVLCSLTNKSKCKIDKCVSCVMCHGVWCSLTGLTYRGMKTKCFWIKKRIKPFHIHTVLKLHTLALNQWTCWTSSFNLSALHMPYVWKPSLYQPWTSKAIGVGSVTVEWRAKYIPAWIICVAWEFVFPLIPITRRWMTNIRSRDEVRLANVHGYRNDWC